MPQNCLIHEAVRARAAAHPNATALVHPGGTVSYGELDRWSDEIAAVLAQAGVRPGTIVPVLLPPSALLPAALLAVLKCGAAYAALDIGWPDQRLVDIARLLPGQVAVTGPDAGRVFAHRRVVLYGDSLPVPDVAARPPLVTEADAGAAMVFFTSGSSGAPKAVLSPHQAIMRLFIDCTFARFDRTTVMAQTAAVPWDAFAMEVWGPLTTGGTCVVITERPLTPAGLREAVARHGVNMLFLTTSLFHIVVEEDLAAFAGLHTVVVGGEKLSAPHAGQLLEAWPELRLVNGYGPVESAVFVLTHDVRPDDVRGEIPLGRPVPRTRVLLMRRDERFGEQCTDGETGEICVGGDGLALRYLGDDELTGRKFVTAVIDGRPTRLYRTGDLGHRDPNGVVHFHGRTDRQVKVRGHRLEPDGIERVAGAVPGVRRCVAAAQRDGTGNVEGLLLFYLPTDSRPSEPELTAALRLALPGYSVPDRVVAVEELPVTTTGKVATALLLARFADGTPGPPADGGAGRTAVPESAENIVSAEVVSLLGLGDVDHSASLFTLGATSLTLIRLCTRLGARVGRAIPMSQVMRDPSVIGIAGWLAGSGPGESGTGPQSVGARTGGAFEEAPLTPMQHSFLLQHLGLGADLANHCLLSWTIDGPLDPARLALAVQDVHRYHGFLSGRYEADDVVRVTPGRTAAEFIQLAAERSGTAEALLQEQFRRPFDLGNGRVWRAVLVHDRGREQWLFGVVVHHVAFDGWSQHLMAREIGLAYTARGRSGLAASGTPVPDPAQTHHLLDTLAQAVDLTGQRAYWAERLRGMPALHWPASAPDPDAASGPAPTGAPASDGRPDSVEYALDKGTVAQLSRIAQRQGTGLLAVLLDEVYRAVSEYTGQADFGVGVPVSTRSTEALQGQIGCLIDTVCVPLRNVGVVPGGVAAALTEALANADLPFAEVVRAVRPPRTGRHPLYQVITAVQDSPEPLLGLSGCRTVLVGQDVLAWPQAELLVELFAHRQGPRLRVSRAPGALDFPSLAAVAEAVINGLRSRAGRRPARTVVAP